MNAFLRRRLRKITAVLPLCLFLVACASSQNEDCNFEIESILNGENLATPSSEWDCRRQDESFTLALYSDKTGTHSFLGKFTWKDLGCGNYAYHSAAGSGQAGGLSLSADSRQLSYTDSFQGQFSSVFCTLDETPDGLSF